MKSFAHVLAGIWLLVYAFEVNERKRKMDDIFHQSLFGLAITCTLFHLHESNRKEARLSLKGVEMEKKYFNISYIERLYLPVYFLVFRIILLILVADWLQGAYIYALYDSRGLSIRDIAYLFVAGFLSSGIAGPFVGMMIDFYGRKKGCLMFCFLFSISCSTKLSHNFYVLLVGRIIGGVSTSLLQTAFESWLIAASTEHGVFEEELCRTFAKSTSINAIAAILSGVIAYWLVHWFGYVAPFLFSILVLGFAGFLIAKKWPENYGTLNGSMQVGWKESFNILFNGDRD
jgi:MFS family permease